MSAPLSASFVTGEVRPPGDPHAALLLFAQVRHRSGQGGKAAVVNHRAVRGRFLLFRPRGAKGGACRRRRLLSSEQPSLWRKRGRNQHRPSCSERLSASAAQCRYRPQQGRAPIKRVKSTPMTIRFCNDAGSSREIFSRTACNGRGIGSLSIPRSERETAAENIVWFQSNEAIDNRSGLSYSRRKYRKSPRPPMRYLDVSRIQLHCTLEVAHGIVPTALPSIDRSSSIQKFVRCWAGCGGQWPARHGRRS